MTAAATIRVAMPEDADALIALFAAYRAEADTPPSRLTAAVLRRDGLGRCFKSLVATAPNGPLIGFALWQPTYEPDNARAGGYLSDLYVTPTWRRRGVASALICAVARAVKATNGRFLAWSTERENAGARALYDRIAEAGENLVPYISDAKRFDALAG